MDAMESWQRFLNKKIVLFLNDEDRVRKKEGLCLGVTGTHLIMQQDFGEIAVLLSDIKRVELRGEQ